MESLVVDEVEVDECHIRDVEINAGRVEDKPKNESSKAKDENNRDHEL